MKKLLLASIFILAISTARAQSYYPLLADSNYWAVYSDVMPLLEQSHGNPQVQSNFMSGYVWKIKDTLVDSMNYTMFYSRTHEGILSQWSLLREDTATQQVFIWSAGDTAERIIYDFSLNTGDSIWLDFMYQQPNYLQTGWWRVDSVTMYPTVLGQRKSLYLYNPNNPMHSGQPRFIQWIEGVGCNLSPLYLDETTEEMMTPVEFSMGPGCEQNRHFYSTTCAWKDSVLTFRSQCWQNVHSSFATWGDTCVFNLMGAVTDPIVGIEKSQLMPNPSNEKTLLTFTNGTAVEFGITITNILGEEIEKVTPVTWYAAGFHSVEISTAELPAGIYCINLRGETGLISMRLVVQR